jgi:hypothetical protein
MALVDKRQKVIAEQLFATFRHSRIGAPVRRAFVLKTESGPSPLVRLLNQRNGKSGGPGGGLRAQLYLSLLWVCASSPYQTDRPARVWAQLLSLEDPETNGTRRIRAALKELGERRFVRQEMTKPTPTIHLLSDLGDGSEYVPPGIAIGKAAEETKARHEYFRVPNAIWTDGYINDMDGPALAMFLVLLAESRGLDKKIWLSPRALEELYGISPSTRTKGISRLKDLGLITVEKQVLEAQATFSPSRQIYRIPMLAEAHNPGK